MLREKIVFRKHSFCLDCRNDFKEIAAAAYQLKIEAHQSP